jgi:polyhydroxyalkanoate synthesis repressor PhaR
MPLIKKYENRRLYDTSASRYVNLEDISRMVEHDEELVVSDVKTGRDLTRDVLLQIVLEGEDDASALPTALLRRIIRTRGHEPERRLLREQLVLGLELLDAQLGHSEAYLRGLYAASVEPSPLVAERAAAPYESAPPVAPLGMRTPFAAPRHTLPAAPNPELPPEPAWRADPAGMEELDALREELGRLEARLKR